tara:strand:+ start:3150 stop:6371 length:3222 start_codon:yes stop_codon:yes gene_type:complete
MKTYNVKLAKGVFVRVNADNPEDAAAKAKAEIAKREGSIAYDKVYFDYETGIQNNALRAQLAVAEDFYRKDGEYVAEKENVLNRFPGIGPTGYVRDSKGSYALTPEGQAGIGLKASNKNIVIDENKAGTAGDFADLAGYAGPVLGAIASVNPYLRSIKWLKGAVDSRIGRALLVGAGSGVGKALEESNEIARGVQLQNEEEIAKMVKDEAVLGAAFQGGAEVLGGIFKTYFGKTATTGNVRDSNLIMGGYNLKDAFRIDAQMAIKKGIDDPNYKATLDEVLKEFKKQKIKPTLPKGIVTQAIFGKPLVSRTQQISEAVTGASVREKKASANLVAQMDDFFVSVGNSTATIDDFISAGAIGKTAGQELKEATVKFTKKMNISDQKLDDLLKKMVYEMNTVQELGEVSGSALKEELQQSIQKAHKIFIDEKNLLYIKSTDALKTAGAMPAVQQHVRGFASRFKEIFEKAEFEDVLAKYQGKPVTYLKELSEGGRLESLEQLNNARLEVKALLTKMRADSKSGGTSYRMMKDVKDEIDTLFKDLESGKAFLGGKSRFTPREGPKSQLEGKEPDFFPGEEGFETQKIFKRPDADFGDVPTLEMNAAMNAARALGKANQYYAQGMQKFDNAIAQRVINNIKLNKGRANADEIFGLIDMPNNSKLVDQILSNIDAGQRDMFRGKLTRLLMQNVIKNSIDQTSGLLKPVQFSNNILKYEDTLRPLFGPNYEQNLQLLREIVILNPKLNKKDLNRFLYELKVNPEKYTMANKNLDTANTILKTLKEKAVLSADAERLNKSVFMKTVNRETPEKIVESIFRPQSAADINYLKNTLDPATFKKVQENAMGQLLTDAVSVGTLKSTAKLSDIFKPNQFRNAMESYGDETLEAMFGKDQLLGFKAFQQSLDLQVGPKGMGQAGGIVAGAIGAQVANISLMPTIVGLKIFANIMANPRIVRLMARTDKSSALEVIDAFEKATRLTFAQSLQEQTGQIESGIMQEMRQQIESPQNQSAVEELRGQVEQVTKPLLNAIPDLPEIMPTNPTAQNNQAPISRSLLGGNPANEEIFDRRYNEIDQGLQRLA